MIKLIIGESIEYWDLYDENRKLTGEKILKDDKIFKYCIIFIENKRGELLLQVKKYNKWSTTGGHPKSGDTSIEGIITGVKEELGIDISSDEVILFKNIQTEDDFV